MKKCLLTSLSLALCFAVQTAHAEGVPKGSRYDTRIKTIDFNPDNVTRVNVRAGISSLIQLHSNELIEGVGLGDSEAWNVNVQGSNIWIKPIADNPDTNLTITTNRRTYFFSLVSTKSRNSASWGVRFRYPELAKTPISPWVKPCTGGTQNYRYFAQGEGDNKRILPLEVWDNGQQTCFRFAISGEMPVIFRKLPDGKEGLVNSHITNDYVVLHEINSEYRIRLGDLVIGLKTDNLQARSIINGTTNGKRREVIDE